MECACEVSGGMWWMMLLPVVVLAVLTVVGVLMVRTLWDRFRARSSGSSGALSLLEDRYARGEIDQEEFTSRRRDLVETRGKRRRSRESSSHGDA